MFDLIPFCPTNICRVHGFLFLFLFFYYTLFGSLNRKWLSEKKKIDFRLSGATKSFCFVRSETWHAKKHIHLHPSNQVWASYYKTNKQVYQYGINLSVIMHLKDEISWLHDQWGSTQRREDQAQSDCTRTKSGLSPNFFRPCSTQKQISVIDMLT